MRTRPLLLALLAACGGAILGSVATRRFSGHHDVVEDLWALAEAGVPAAASTTADTSFEQLPDAEIRRLAVEKADAVAAARREGDAGGRGRQGSVGFDLNRLDGGENSLEPVVQYLTYIQSRRGEDSSLLFIRYDDIDAMAELDGEPSEDLLKRLDQLGVVVSAN